MTDDKFFVQDIPKGNCSIMTLSDWTDKFSHIHGIHPALEIIHDPVAYYDATEAEFSLIRSQKLERGFDVDDWIFERDTFPFSRSGIIGPEGLSDLNDIKTTSFGFLANPL